MTRKPSTNAAPSAAAKKVATPAPAKKAVAAKKTPSTKAAPKVKSTKVVATTKAVAAKVPAAPAPKKTVAKKVVKRVSKPRRPDGELTHTPIPQVVTHDWSGIKVVNKTGTKATKCSPGFGIDGRVAACSCGWMGKRHETLDSEAYWIQHASDSIEGHGLSKDEAKKVWDLFPVIVSYDDETGDLHATKRTVSSKLSLALLKKCGFVGVIKVSTASAPKATPAGKKAVAPVVPAQKAKATANAPKAKLPMKKAATKPAAK